MIDWNTVLNGMWGRFRAEHEAERSYRPSGVRVGSGISYISVGGNFSEGSGNGISIEGGAKAAIYGATVTHNAGDGLRVKDDSEVTVVGGDFSHNGKGTRKR